MVFTSSTGIAPIYCIASPKDWTHRGRSTKNTKFIMFRTASQHLCCLSSQLPLADRLFRMTEKMQWQPGLPWVLWYVSERLMFWLKEPWWNFLRENCFISTCPFFFLILDWLPCLQWDNTRRGGKEEHEDAKPQQHSDVSWWNGRWQAQNRLAGPLFSWVPARTTVSLIRVHRFP